MAEPRRDLSATKGAEGERSHLTTVRRRLRSPEERDRISPLLPPPQEVQGESGRSSPPSPPLPEEPLLSRLRRVRMSAAAPQRHRHYQRSQEERCCTTGGAGRTVVAPHCGHPAIGRARRSAAAPHHHGLATGEPGGERPHHAAIDPPPEKSGGAWPYLAALALSSKKPRGAWPRLAAVAPPPENREESGRTTP